MAKYHLDCDRLLFDRQYYSAAVKQKFGSHKSAYRHFLRTGANQDKDPSIFFFTKFYRDQLKEPLCAANPLGHYLREGFKHGYNPTPFFNQRWYEWQNPDCHSNHANPYFHFLEIGRFQGRDPSPLVDMIHYQQILGNSIPPEDCYELILNGLRGSALGVYSDWQDLINCQELFRDGIHLYAHRSNLFCQKKAYLVFLQCGSQSRHREWFCQNKPRNWDLLVNYYDYTGFDYDFGDYIFFQPGTKFTAIFNLWTKYRSLLADYRYILLLDDDIYVDMASLNELFRICDHNRLDLAQMSLSNESHCVWDVFFKKGEQAMRHVNAVEIMMPVLSQKAMAMVGYDFRLSVSGFGLDLLFGKKLLNRTKDNIAVIDQITAVHDKAIDDVRGGYYAYLRSRNINPKAELWHLIEKYLIDKDFYEV